MTERKTAAQLRENAAATETTMAAQPKLIDNVLDKAIEEFRQNSTRYYEPTAAGLEALRRRDFMVHPIGDSVMEPVQRHLAAGGYATDGTVGTVMKALGVSRTDIHYLACGCNYNGAVTGGEAAYRLQLIQDRRRRSK